MRINAKRERGPPSRATRPAAATAAAARIRTDPGANEDQFVVVPNRVHGIMDGATDLGGLYPGARQPGPRTSGSLPERLRWR